ncbi:hypothetical protein EOL96_01025 [Candidatus Saccharibacteria bacterium]|nr:hypothetical protein [Candidatus Saccharibacteria bacterium]
MSVESMSINKEFEQKLSYEIEQKFLPIFPEGLEIYRSSGWPVEQFYLSHPSEDFSLRMREELKNGELTYEATLKDTGTVTGAGIARMEVTTPITPELYQLYRSPDTPILRKVRAEPLPGITVDYYEDGSVQVESESPANWLEFIRLHGDTFVEITGDRNSDNEWKAHLSFRRTHSGNETLKPSAELSPHSIVNDILVASRPDVPTKVHVAGRSGSGKSTIVREIKRELEGLGIDSIVLSTDDYHRGNTWLTQYNDGEPWTKWDDAIVYDTAAMANDLAELHAGRPIWQRTIDFSVCEPKIAGVLQPTPVIIIEGIYAKSTDISSAERLGYEMTTPLATCVGRLLLRDLRERPQFADPAASLDYILREAEPSYRNQSKVLA